MNPLASDKAQVLNVLPVSSITGSSAGSAIDLKEYSGEIAFILDGDSVAGTNPTLAVKLTECDTEGGSYTDVSGGAFTQLAGPASVQKLSLLKESLKRYVKVDYTIGGTDSPEFLVSVKGVAWKKYG